MSKVDRRHFGPATLAALVVANMIGAGLFSTSEFTLAGLDLPELFVLRHRDDGQWVGSLVGDSVAGSSALSLNHRG